MAIDVSPYLQRRLRSLNEVLSGNGQAAEPSAAAMPAEERRPAATAAAGACRPQAEPAGDNS